MHNSKKAQPLDMAPVVTPGIEKVRTKSTIVLGLLNRDQGATLMELFEATSWQHHTIRAMLTRLRKKGHAIERRRRDDASYYFLPTSEA